MSRFVFKETTLLLVWWYPGTGKSYTSDKILKDFYLMYVDKDLIDDVFSLTRTDEHYENHKKYVWKVIYDAILIPNISRWNSVLIDSPFSSQYLGNSEWIKYIKNLSRKYNFKIKMIWCKASCDTREDRLKMRNHPRDQERYHELKDFVAREKIFDIPFDHITFDTEKDDMSIINDFLRKEDLFNW